MTIELSVPRSATSALLPVATAALAIGICIADILTGVEITLAVLYVVVVLMATRFCDPTAVVLFAVGCTGLTVLSYFLSGETAINTTIAVAAIGVTTFLALQSQSAEAALRASEEQWREVFEHNPVMYFMVSRTGSVLSVNGFGAANLGYTTDELIGQSVLNVFFDEDRDLVKNQLMTCAEEPGHSHSWEIQKVRKDGSVLWVRENAKAVRRSADDVVVLIACEDITERRHAEAALRASGERWRKLFETSAAGMALSLLDGGFTAANPALQRMLGRAEEEIVGHNVLELNPENERAATADALAKYRSGALSERQVEKKYLKKDGSPVWLNITTTVVPATETTPPFLQSVYMDITERVLAEAALRASEERWRAIFDSAAVGIAAGDLRGGLFDVNPTFQKMLGYTEEELRNLRDFEFTHEDDRTETRRLFSRVVTGQQPSYRLEKRYRRKDGAIVWADVSASSVPATGNAPAFLAVMAVDITDRKRAEEALREAEERFRTLVQFSFDVYWESDAQHRFIRQEFAEGLADAPAPGAEIGKTRWEVPYLEPDAEAWRKHRETLDTHLPFRDFEHARPTPDGGKRYTSVSGLPVFDKAGRFIGYRGVGRYITDRKRAEAALRASEERWRAMFKSAAVGIATGVLDGGVLSMNPTFQRMLGYAESEIQNLTVFEFTHEDDRAETRRLFSDLASGSQRSYRLEKRYRRKDGGTVWADVSASLVPATDTAPAFLAVMAVDITDRKRAEAALRANEERWRRMYETSAAGIATAHLDGVFTAANPALRRMLDRTEDEIVGHTAIAITHEDERAETENVVAKFRSGLQQEYHVEKRYLKKDGSPVWLNVTTTLVPATEIAEPFLQAIYINITDRKRAEAALRASEERWRAMFETAPVGITMLDFEHRRYLAANEAFQRMTGYSEEELRQLTALDVTHEEDRAAAQQRIVDGIRGVLQPKRYRRKDGGVIWADVTSFVVPATESTPAFLGAVVVDITDRKLAEDALRRSEAYLNEVFVTLPDGVAIVGRDYRYQRVNAVYERRSGLAARQVAGMHVAEINGADAFTETIKPALDRCFTGEHVSYGDWFTHAISGRRYLAVTYSPLFIDGPDRPSAVLAITRDLTEFMLASDALQQAHADLARLNRVMVLEEMAASIAHEVNQPISAVITNASAGLRWLGARPPDVKEARQALGRIARDGTRAGEVIGRIRALKKVPPRRDSLDINEAIREVIALTQTEMQRNGVELRARLAGNLPSVSADRVQLQQVIMNLIVNAVEAMSGVGDGARELTIASGEDDAAAVFVEVKDTGPGIDPAHLDRLFQSFYTTKPDGIGMGLAISRSIVEAHGGQLSAAPNKPKGAVFRLTLRVEATLSRSPKRSPH